MVRSGEECVYCGYMDAVEHTIFHCKSWAKYYTENNKQPRTGNKAKKLCRNDARMQRTLGCVTHHDSAYNEKKSRWHMKAGEQVVWYTKLWGRTILHCKVAIDRKAHGVH